MELYNDDCLKVLPKIPENSVDLIITSPPYEDISGAGYTSNSKLVIGSEYVESVESNQPKLVTDLGLQDHLRNIVWYPSVINIPLKGMIFPMGTLEEWHWEVMKVREVTEEEKEKYPIPDSDGDALVDAINSFQNVDRKEIQEMTWEKHNQQSWALQIENAIDITIDRFKNNTSTVMDFMV